VIRHVSLLQFTPDSTDAQLDEIMRDLATLPDRLRFESYAFGRDLEINEGNYDIAVVADFATVDDYLAYRDDPEHRRVIAELIRPILASRVAVQYEV
jgi:hypothetical protein